MGVTSMLLTIPAVTALLILLLPGRNPRAAQWVALAGALSTLLVALGLVVGFDPAGGVQFEQRTPWVPEIGISFHIGIDGLSLTMVLLTALLTVVALVASQSTVASANKGYCIWFMLLEGAILGVFVAQDWFLFYLFWEVALIPMFFLIGIWGEERRGAASMSFFLYTLAGSMVMLVGLMAAYLATPGHTFEMAAIADAAGDWSGEFQALVFTLVFVGLAVKVPAVPIHGWLPLAHVQAPAPVSIMLSGVLLKMGGFGLFRLIEMVPLGAQWFGPMLMALGLLSILYGAFMAWKQDDLKAMVAFSSISHMGFVLLGIGALNLEGLRGAMVQMFAHGLVTASLFMLVGIVYHHTHSRQLSELRLAGRQAPVFGVVLGVSLLAAMGLPGLSGFVGEFYAVIGAFERSGLSVLLAMAGIVVTTVYCLRVFGRMLVGDGAMPTGAATTMEDLNPGEMVALLPLVALMLTLGLFPGLIMSLSEGAVSSMAVLQLGK